MTTADQACVCDWAVGEWQLPISGQGGDFVVFERDRRGARLFIGDVTGHGGSAATVASLIHRVIRCQLRRGLTCSALRRWNRIVPRLLGDRFVAFTCVEINRDSGMARLAIAGNPSVIIRRSGGGPLEQYQSDGMPLGLVGDAEWRGPTFRRVMLRPGDEMICFTDGLTDALGRWNHHRFGMDRVLSTLDADEKHDAVRSLSDSVNSFVDRAVEQDDITVLSLSQVVRHAA